MKGKKVTGLSCYIHTIVLFSLLTNLVFLAFELFGKENVSDEFIVLQEKFEIVQNRLFSLEKLLSNELESSFMDEIESSKHRIKNYLDTLTELLEDSERMTQSHDIFKFLKDELEELLDRKLQVLQADSINRTDYALWSMGAKIVNVSPSLCRIPWWIVSFLRFFQMDPCNFNSVISPNSPIGDCLALQGSQGNISLLLPSGVIPSAFSLDHVDKHLLPKGSNQNIPKEFRVWGYNSSSQSSSRAVDLGSYVYNREGPRIQTFELPVGVGEKKSPFVLYRFELLSNYGDETYTCLYRFRIHGERGNFAKMKRSQEMISEEHFVVEVAESEDKRNEDEEKIMDSIMGEDEEISEELEEFEEYKEKVVSNEDESFDMEGEI